MFHNLSTPHRNFYSGTPLTMVTHCTITASVDRSRTGKTQHATENLFLTTKRQRTLRNSYWKRWDKFYSVIKILFIIIFVPPWTFIWSNDNNVNYYPIGNRTHRRCLSIAYLIYGCIDKLISVAYGVRRIVSIK